MLVILFEYLVVSFKPEQDYQSTSKRISPAANKQTRKQKQLFDITELKL